MNELMNFLQAVYSNDISRAFGLAIGVIFVFGITNLNSRSRKTQAIIHHAPSAMTSLGILGTFLESLLGSKTSISIRLTKACLSFLKV